MADQTESGQPKILLDAGYLEAFQSPVAYAATPAQRQWLTPNLSDEYWESLRAFLGPRITAHRLGKPAINGKDAARRVAPAVLSPKRGRLETLVLSSTNPVL